MTYTHKREFKSQSV